MHAVGMRAAQPLSTASISPVFSLSRGNAPVRARSSSCLPAPSDGHELRLFESWISSRAKVAVGAKSGNDNQLWRFIPVELIDNDP